MRYPRPLLWLVSSIAGITILASCAQQTRNARTAAPTQAECRIVLQSTDHDPGMKQDSMQEALLDSAAVQFREGRRPVITDSTKWVERAPQLLNQHWLQARISDLYPPDMRRLKIGGESTVLFVVRPDSTTERWRVIRSSGSVELDMAAVQVIREARMAPGMYHGCAVSTLAIMPVTWTSQPARSF